MDNKLTCKEVSRDIHIGRTQPEGRHIQRTKTDRRGKLKEEDTQMKDNKLGEQPQR